MYKILFSIFLLYLSFISPAFAGNSTREINLQNEYAYRLIERGSSINPYNLFTNNFRPVSAREVHELFDQNSEIEIFADRTNLYYLQKAEAKKSYSYKILDQIILNGIYSEKEDAALYSSFGKKLDENYFGSVELGGNGRFKDFAAFSYALRAGNDKDADDLELYRYRLKTGFKHLALAVAKDNLSMGPGYFGNLLVSNNIKPENTVLLKTEYPYDWGWLGAFRGYLWHTWFDDENRENQDPNLFGMRLSLMPHYCIEIGFARTIFYGGSGNPSYNGFNDYWKLFTAEDENVPGSKWDNDQHAGFDISIYLPFIKGFTPFKGGKLYCEYAFSDIHGFWQKEDQGSKKYFRPYVTSFLPGLFLTTGKTDFRFEGIFTNKVAYSHHNYSDQGYSDGGYFIGHYAGNAAKGFFCEIYNETNLKVHCRAGARYIERGGYDNITTQTEKSGFGGVTWFITSALTVDMKYEYRTYDKTDMNTSPVRYSFIDKEYTDNIIYLKMSYSF